jgi:hypothetical protein
MAENEHEHYIKPYAGGPLEHDKCILRSHYLPVFSSSSLKWVMKLSSKQIALPSKSPLPPNYQ